MVDYDRTVFTRGEAGYRPADPGDGRCGECHYFDNNRCSLVPGFIKSNYTCDYFESSGNPGSEESILYTSPYDVGGHLRSSRSRYWNY